MSVFVHFYYTMVERISDLQKKKIQFFLLSAQYKDTAFLV